jgi:hypothetical protein
MLSAVPAHSTVTHTGHPVPFHPSLLGGTCKACFLQPQPLGVTPRPAEKSLSWSPTLSAASVL